MKKMKNMTRFQKIGILVGVLVLIVVVNHQSNKADKAREKKFDNCMNVVKEENMPHEYQVEYLKNCMDK